MIRIVLFLLAFWPTILYAQEPETEGAVVPSAAPVVPPSAPAPIAVDMPTINLDFSGLSKTISNPIFQVMALSGGLFLSLWVIELLFGQFKVQVDPAEQKRQARRLKNEERARDKVADEYEYKDALKKERLRVAELKRREQEERSLDEAGFYTTMAERSAFHRSESSFRRSQAAVPVPRPVPRCEDSSDYH